MSSSTRRAVPAQPPELGPAPEAADSRVQVSSTQRALLLLALALLPFLAARLWVAYLSWPELRSLGGGELVLAFLVGVRFDLAALLPILLGPLALGALPLASGSLRWRRVWGWIAFAPLIPLSFLLMADGVYFQEVGRHVAREAVLIAHDPSYLVAMSFEHLLLGAVGLVGLSALGFGWWRVLELPATQVTAQRRTWIVFLLVFSLGGLGIRGSLSRKPIHPLDAYRDHGFAWGNLCLNGAFSAIRASLHFKATPTNPLDLRQALVTLGRDPEAPFPLSQLAVISSRSDVLPGRPNVVVLLLESWDLSVMGSYGAAPSLTPNFDAWAQESWVYEEVYASSQRTVGGVQATLTGIPPVPGLPELGHGIEQAELTRLAARAAIQGYLPLFFQGPRRRSYYLDSFALSSGFAEAYGMEDYPGRRERGGEHAKWGWDEDLYGFVRQRLQRAKQPFFAFVLTGTTHSPYVMPGPEFAVDFPHERHGEKGYRNTMRYADWALGQFLAQARASEWYESTVWIVLADHVYRSARDDLRESFRIPLLVHVPGAAPGRRGGLRSQLDVHATLIEAIGVRGQVSTLGQSLLGPGPGEALVRQGDLLGLISPEGYQSHTLAAPVSTRGLDPTQAQRAERRLLAFQRAVTDLVAANRWAERYP